MIGAGLIRSVAAAAAGIKADILGLFSAASGSDLVGHGAGTVKDALDASVTLTGAQTVEGKTLKGAQSIYTNGARIGITSAAAKLAAPGALIHVVNSVVSASLRISSYWTGSTASPYQNNDGVLVEVFNDVASGSRNLSWAGSYANAYNNIPAGVTDTGERVGVLGWAVSTPVPGYSHDGTLDYQFGLRGRAGFQGPGTPATAVINNAIGVRGEIYNDSAGATITDARAGEFASTATTGVVQNNYAIYAAASGGTVVNYSFYGLSGKLLNIDQILAGSTSTQSSSKVCARGGANSYEFGNPDPNGYGSNIGSTAASGLPFVALCAEADAAGDTFTTRGKKGVAVYTDLLGSLVFGRLPNAAAAGQALIEMARFNDSGQLVLQQTAIMKSRTPVTAADPGTQGEITWDESFIYVCTAANTWKRAMLATW